MGLAGWIALRNLSLSTSDGWIFWVPIASWLVTMGLLCWWSALDGHGTAVPVSGRVGTLDGGLAGSHLRSASSARWY
jgi:hypothetical protein